MSFNAWKVYGVEQRCHKVQCLTPTDLTPHPNVNCLSLRKPGKPVSEKLGMESKG